MPDHQFIARPIYPGCGAHFPLLSFVEAGIRLVLPDYPPASIARGARSIDADAAPLIDLRRSESGVSRVVAKLGQS
jgi:hypothetical protein